jgi:muramidase (phage lysozyme)
MAGGKIIGGPFSNEVIAQLNLRSKIVSKGSRSNEDLQYIAAKTGWAKLTSGVNVGGTSDLAKKYIMVGGVKGRTGADTYSNFTGENSKGFRPMPGITGVQINSVGQFGQLKEATITFNCWDRSQITELELLFMRPGFTALLEWGHTIYAKSETEFVKTPETIQSFFNTGTTKEQLYAEIAEIKKQSGYNYEGMFGFIKNFSWSYRADGGYDCTTSLISIGEIMESLTIDVDTPSVTSTAIVDSSKILPATMLQDILKTIRETDAAGAWTAIEKKFPEFASKFKTVNNLSGLNVANLPLNSVKSGSEIAKPKAKDKFVYISLKSFCALVNTLIVIDNNKKNLIRLNTDIIPIDGDKTSMPICRFRTYKFHTSSDPGVCILMTEGSKNWSYNENLVTALQRSKQGSSDEILNIFVNVNLLEGAMVSLLGKEKSERTLLNLFSPIFAEINDTLGNINDIGFQYEEEEYTYYIVDRKVQVETVDISTLNITGLKSTVSQFNFTTKLSPAITTMCAISAQAGASDVGLEAGALLRWNEGLEDRIITKKSVREEEDTPPSTETPPKLTPQQERDEQQKARRKTVNDALGLVYNSSRQYDKEAIAAARTQYTQYSANYIQFYAEDTANVGNAGPAGIIPFQVGIEMDGISGIKIGQAFRINEGIMPAKYDGVVGFIVTGIDHSIAGNRWVTNLKAQTIVLKGTTAKPTGPTYSDGFTSTGVSTTEKKGIPHSTSAKKISSFGKVSNNVPTYAKPILDTIAYTEGTAAVGNNGYDVLVGFGQLSGWTEDYSKGHPNKLIRLNASLSSTAAGRYQFLKQTWAGNGNLTFSKENQDLVGWKLVNAQSAAKSSYDIAKAQIQKGKIDVNSNTGFLTFLDKNYAVWASLVNRKGESRYGGQDGGLTPADIYKVYTEAVRKYT